MTDREYDKFTDSCNVIREYISKLNNHKYKVWYTRVILYYF